MSEANAGLDRQVIRDFCQYVIDSIIISGGQLSTAYKCAETFARDLESRI